jgi:hypothetical protein
MKAISPKVALNEKAHVALETALHTVLDGFSIVKITKSDLASWIIIDYEKKHLAAALDSIRKAHFDKSRFLLGLAKQLKEAQKQGQSLDLTSLLAPLQQKETSHE